jgi:hypothetical protein
MVAGTPIPAPESDAHPEPQIPTGLRNPAR